MDVIEDRLATPATRRTVVKTGAKLAYAAPLVAASFQLAGLNGVAGASGPGGDGGTCPTGSGYTCRGSVSSCGSDPAAAGQLCACGSKAGGGTTCFANFFVEYCGANDSCPPNSVCVTGTCGGDKVCVPTCGNARSFVRPVLRLARTAAVPAGQPAVGGAVI